MLSSRYLHLHQALGLGPIWLNQSAHIIHEPQAHNNKTIPSTATAPISQQPIVKAQPSTLAIRQQINGMVKNKAPLAEPKSIDIANETPSHTQQLDFATMPLDEIHNHYQQCQACGLHQARRQPIWGIGTLPCELLIITTNPTPQDDLSNTLLSNVTELWENMLLALNIPKDKIFTTAWVKCASHHTLTTQKEERDACLPILKKQAEAAKIILFLGDQDYDLINEVKNWNKPYFQIPHPAKLIRQPALKGQAWRVFKAISKQRI